MAGTLRYLRRRWPLLMAAMLVVVAGVVAALAVAQRDNVFMTLFDPGEPFQVWEPPAAPDYAAPESWALAPALEETDQAAVFFVHPTTYSGGGNWNAPIDKALSRRGVDRVMVPNYAEPFAGAGPVFAPYYRQSSLFSMLTARDDARRSRALAYEDVDRAFAAFLERIGPDRAFLLAGVGQGALHAARLLEERVAGDEDMRSRMIAAYLIEHPLPEPLLDTTLAPLPACRRPGDYRCVTAWVSARAEETKRVRYLADTAMVWEDSALTPVAGRRLLCVNPLLWSTTGDFAPARRNLGAVDAEALEPGVNPSPAPGQTSAECQDGVLLIEKARSKRFRRPVALAERYRVAPYNLFYEDIRLNVQERTGAALARMADEARYADPIEETVIIDDSPVHRVPD